MRYIPIVFAIFLIMILIEVIKTIKKRSKAGEILIGATYENKTSLTFNLIGAFIVLLLYLWNIYKRLNRVVPLLYPQYLDRWYQIFNHKLLEEVREVFAQKGMMYELRIVAQFADIDCYYVMLFILWSIITCTYVYDFFGKKGICDKAIFLGRTSYEWNRISCYEWGEHYYKGNKGLKKLHIFVKYDKVTKWLTGIDTMKVNLAVRIDDYEKAESILRDRITRCDDKIEALTGTL